MRVWGVAWSSKSAMCTPPTRHSPTHPAGTLTPKFTIHPSLRRDRLKHLPRNRPRPRRKPEARAARRRSVARNPPCTSVPRALHHPPDAARSPRTSSDPRLDATTHTLPSQRVESYSSYIYKVLKQVHPDTGISKKGMSIMVSRHITQSSAPHRTVHQPSLPPSRPLSVTTSYP